MKSSTRGWMTAGLLVAATAVAGAAAGGRTLLPATGGGGTGDTFRAATHHGVSFRGTLDRRSVMVGRDGRVRVELVMGAAPADTAERLPTDMVIILDRSGSMAGEKMEHARAAVRELVSQLGPDDRFALVTYANGARVDIPLATVDARRELHWTTTVAGIRPGGGTNMASGLDLGLQRIARAHSAGRVPHAILISDGLANQGDASREGLTRRAGRAAAGEYMLTTVGVGLDFNEVLMTALADAGTGNYYYLENSVDLSEVFARELGAARTTVASGLEVRIDPAAGVRVIDAAGYPLETDGHGVRFRPGSLFAGQERRVWVALAVQPREEGEIELGRFELSFAREGTRHTLPLTETPRIACVADESRFYSNIDRDAWSRSVIVDSYNRMRSEVARDVREGRRDEALRKVREFKDETARMNEHVRSAPVARQLDEAAELEEEVTGAFEGPDQAYRQKLLGKEAGAAAMDARRRGSKR